MKNFIKRSIALISTLAVSLSALPFNYDIAQSMTNVVKAVAAETTGVSTTISAEYNGKNIDNGVVYLENSAGNGFNFTVTTDTSEDLVTKVVASSDIKAVNDYLEKVLEISEVETDGNSVTYNVKFSSDSSLIKKIRDKGLVPGSKCKITCSVNSGNVSTNFDVQICEATDPSVIDVYSVSKSYYTTGSYEFYYGRIDSEGVPQKNNVAVGIFKDNTTDVFRWWINDDNNSDIATIKSNGDNTATLVASSSKTGKITVHCAAYKRSSVDESWDWEQCKEKGDFTWVWKDEIIVNKNNPANEIHVSTTENDVENENEVTISNPLEPLEKNDSLQLYATYDSTDGLPVTDTYNLKWTSSNTNVVTVDNVGNITAVGPGTATVKIEGSAVNENNIPVSAEVVVNVISPSTSIKFKDEDNEQELSSIIMKSKRQKVCIIESLPEDSNDYFFTSEEEKEEYESENQVILNDKQIVYFSVTQDGKEVDDIVDIEVENEPSNEHQITITSLKNAEGKCHIIAKRKDTGKEIGSIDIVIGLSKPIKSVNAYISDATPENEIDENQTIELYEAIKVGSVTYGGKSVNISCKSICDDESYADDALEIEVDDKNESIEYSMSKDNILTLKGIKAETDEEGNPKDITITVINPFENIKKSFKVNVLVPAVGLSISDVADGTNSISKKNLECGNSTIIYGNLLSYDASEPASEKISWKSSDEKKITVTDNGDNSATITSTGVMGDTNDSNTITITATSTNGLTATFNVKIYLTKSVTISGDPTSGIQVEKTCTLSAKVTQSDGELGGTVKWTSSDENIATVDSNGVVTAVGAGDVTITAISGTQSASVDISCWDYISNAEITVLDARFVNAPVEPKLTIEYNGEKLTKNLDYTVTYSNNVNVTKSAVATITGKGNFAGEYTATFAIEDTGVKNPATQIKFIENGVEIADNGTVYLDVNDEVTCDIELSNGTSTCDDFVITSSTSTATSKILSISTSNNGLVKEELLIRAGKTPGIYSINITAYGGEINKTINVRVYKPATSIVINSDTVKNLTENTMTMIADHSVKLSAVIAPTDSTDSVTWSVSNTEIAKISEDGTLNALKNGTVRVTATIKATENDERGLSQSCLITIIKNNPVTAMSFDSNVLNLGIGSQKKLTLTKIGLDTTSEPTDIITWSSSDDTIATVDQDGKIKTHAAGSAIISATSEYGVVVDCLVNSFTPSTELKTISSMIMLNGQEKEVSVQLSPADSNEILSWSSSNENVATVEIDQDSVGENVQNAVIKAVGDGTCRIIISTVRSADDSGVVPVQQTASITIVVKECEHSDTYEVITKEATTTESGLKDIYCSDCGQLLKSNVIINMDEEGEKITLGDANEDKRIDSKDAVRVLQYYASKLAGKEIEINQKQSDINGDGNINAKDAVMILRYYAYNIVYKSDITMEEYIKRSGMLIYA